MLAPTDSLYARLVVSGRRARGGTRYCRGRGILAPPCKLFPAAHVRRCWPCLHVRTVASAGRARLSLAVALGCGPCRPVPSLVVRARCNGLRRLAPPRRVCKQEAARLASAGFNHGQKKRTSTQGGNQNVSCSNTICATTRVFTKMWLGSNL